MIDATITDAARLELRRVHTPAPAGSAHGSECKADRQQWPCDAIRLLTALEGSEAREAALRTALTAGLTPGEAARAAPVPEMLSQAIRNAVDGKARSDLRGPTWDITRAKAYSDEYGRLLAADTKHG